MVTVVDAHRVRDQIMIQATDFYSEEAYHEALESRVATESEAVAEFTRNVGAERPEQAWILSNYDSWERNPFYSGPAAPHPEDEMDDARHEANGDVRLTQAEIDAIIEGPASTDLPF